MKLYKAITSKYIREISGIKNGIENDNNEFKCKVQDRDYKKI